MPYITNKLAPPNSIVLLEDKGGGDIPESVGDSLVVATKSCVAIGCKAEDDGETEITLGNEYPDTLNLYPAFEGRLPTPSGVLCVRSVYGDNILELRTATAETQVQVWVNHAKEPDRIYIMVGGVSGQGEMELPKT